MGAGTSGFQQHPPILGTDTGSPSPRMPGAKLMLFLSFPPRRYASEYTMDWPEVPRKLHQSLNDHKSQSWRLKHVLCGISNFICCWKRKDFQEQHRFWWSEPPSRLFCALLCYCAPLLSFEYVSKTTVSFASDSYSLLLFSPNDPGRWNLALILSDFLVICHLY